MNGEQSLVVSKLGDKLWINCDRCVLCCGLWVVSDGWWVMGCGRSVVHDWFEQ